MEQNTKFQRIYFEHLDHKIIPANLKRFLEKRWSNIRSSLNIKPDSKILEIGSGDGQLMDYIADITGCSSIVGCELAFERLKYHHSNTPNAKLLQTDCKALPFKEGSFDIVIASEVLHHVEAKFHERVLYEIRRVLRPDGTLWMLEPNRWHPLMIAAGLFLKADRLVFRFSIPRVCSILKGLGYKSIVVRPFNCYTYPSRKIYPEFLRAVVERLEDVLEHPGVCTSYCIVARKV